MLILHGIKFGLGQGESFVKKCVFLRFSLVMLHFVFINPISTRLLLDGVAQGGGGGGKGVFHPPS